MMNTQLRQLRHVVTLGKLLSFTKAAKELGITQSALTRSIQTIEERTQVRLFDRDRGQVRLTEVGKAYLERAAVILQEVEDLDRLLDQTAVAKVGEVRLGTTPLISWALMRDMLSKELAERSQLRTHVLVGSPEKLVDLVQAEEMEFCICPELPVLPTTLRSAFIGTFPLSFMVRAGHPLLDGFEHLDPNEFPLLLSGQLLHKWRAPEALRRFLTSPPQISIEDFGILTHLTMSSDAIWFSSRHAVFDELRRGVLQELPMPEGLELKFRAFMYSHNRRTLSPAAKRAARLIRAQMARLTGGGPPASAPGGK